jgi:hypothetical protein
MPTFSGGDAMSARKPRPSKDEHEQDLLDEALEETFPASDTPALVVPGGGITGPNNAPAQSEDNPKRTPSSGRRRRGPQ